MLDANPVLVIVPNRVLGARIPLVSTLLIEHVRLVDVLLDAQPIPIGKGNLVKGGRETCLRSFRVITEGRLIVDSDAVPLLVADSQNPQRRCVIILRYGLMEVFQGFGEVLRDGDGLIVYIPQNKGGRVVTCLRGQLKLAERRLEVLWGANLAADIGVPDVKLAQVSQFGVVVLLNLLQRNSDIIILNGVDQIPKRFLVLQHISNVL